MKKLLITIFLMTAFVIADNSKQEYQQKKAQIHMTKQAYQQDKANTHMTKEAYQQEKAQVHMSKEAYQQEKAEVHMTKEAYQQGSLDRRLCDCLPRFIRGIYNYF